jgi:hypothetical protein
MRVVISLPGRTFEAAERVSKRLGMSLDRFFTLAVEGFVRSHPGDDVREALAAVYGSEPAAVDPMIDRLQGEALREEW